MSQLRHITVHSENGSLIHPVLSTHLHHLHQETQEIKFQYVFPCLVYKQPYQQFSEPKTIDAFSLLNFLDDSGKICSHAARCLIARWPDQPLPDWSITIWRRADHLSSPQLGVRCQIRGHPSRATLHAKEHLKNPPRSSHLATLQQKLQLDPPELSLKHNYGDLINNKELLDNKFKNRNQGCKQKVYSMRR